MGKVLELAERFWQGDPSGHNVHKDHTLVALEVLSDQLAFMSAFSNALAVRTTAGLVLVDTSSPFHAYELHRSVREWTPAALHTAVYTHGHVDHVFGVIPFEQEARAAGQPAPEVIAHENCPLRFDRYKLTQGYNAVINARQFGFPKVFPDRFRYPDRTLRDRLELEIGDTRFSLFHDKGETDDHVWAWLPDQKVLYTGDLFIWAAPNCGNPQKVQRYPREAALALRKMAALEPELLCPGHGPPIVGRARVVQALTESAMLLETIVEQSLAMMNDGAALNDLLYSVKIPAALLERPYLRPVYDDPTFIIRNVWRLYGGWYDGNPAHLKPARDQDLGRAVAALAGGVEALAARATELASAGQLAVAAHLAELAVAAEPDNATAHGARAAVYEQRVAEETALMAKSIFGAAARESRAKT